MGLEPQNTEGEQPECRPLSLRFFFSCESATLPEGEKAAKMETAIGKEWKKNHDL